MAYQRRWIVFVQRRDQALRASVGVGSRRGRTRPGSVCYLTTTGRVSGRPHIIEIWFARRGATLYLLSGGGGRADWVRNLRREPRVTVRIGRRDRPALAARARVLEPDSPEDREARRLVYDKYRGGYGGDLTRWRDTALPVVVDLDDR